MQMTYLWLLILATAAVSDSLLSNEGADLERVMAVAKQQEERIQQLESALEGLDQKYNALVLSQKASRVEQLEEVLANLEREWAKGAYAYPRNSPIAFTASLSSTFSGGGNYAVVPYDTVYLNHGEAYSTTDYHFTAPVRGLYWFTVTMVSEDRSNAKISVNGDHLFVAEESGGRSGAAASAILMLEAQDRVACVKALDGYRLYEHNVGKPHFNTFAGFLYAPL